MTDYIGVYSNDSIRYEKPGYPYRAAMKFIEADGSVRWEQLGITTNEHVAARINNMYAVYEFGKKAVLNVITKWDAADHAEFESFVNSTPMRRATFDRAVIKKRELDEAGTEFRTNIDVIQNYRALQAARIQEAAQQDTQEVMVA